MDYDGLCELLEFAKMVVGDCIYDLPVDGFILMHGDVSETDCSLGPAGQCIRDHLHTTEPFEPFGFDPPHAATQGL